MSNGNQQQPPTGTPNVPATPTPAPAPRSPGTTILIAVLGAAAGAAAVRMLDRTIFAKDKERELSLEEDLAQCRAERAALRSVKPDARRPRPLPLPPPPPPELSPAQRHEAAMNRILNGAPRSRVSNDFWARLSGGLEDEDFDFDV